MKLSLVEGKGQRPLAAGGVFCLEVVEHSIASLSASKNHKIVTHCLRSACAGL
jgi:hypothetical protein